MNSRNSENAFCIDFELTAAAARFINVYKATLPFIDNLFFYDDGTDFAFLCTIV